ILDLRLLQAQDVGLVRAEPRDEPVGPRADRVDVPGRELHAAHPTSSHPARTVPTRNRNSRALSRGMRAVESLLDRHRPSNVRKNMKAENNLTVWSIIERLQRRLERQGMSAREADQAVAKA